MKKAPTIIGTIAYFISPHGEIEEVPLSHIATVIKSPALFDLTPDKISATYLKHDEPVGLEGKAREELLNQVIQSGWIRLRRYPNRQWSITVNRLTQEKKLLLQVWAETLISGFWGIREADVYLPVVITQVRSEKKILTTMEGLLEKYHVGN